MAARFATSATRRLSLRGGVRSSNCSLGRGFGSRAQFVGREADATEYNTRIAGAPPTSNHLCQPSRYILRGVAGYNWQRHKSSLVEASETSRATTYPKFFCEWLAGIIDGDGSLQVSKQGYTSLEITMGLEDLQLLRYIQHMLGGSIKMRAGAKAYRYRLHNHLGMIKLMNCVNGHIRHSARLLQLHRVCQELEIPVILPIPLDAQSNWFAGFFDADGAITIGMKDGLPQLSIGVTNKLLQDVESYKVVFGGSLYFDSGRNGYYQWSIQSRKDVIMMLDYFKSNTFRSHKSRGFFLIKEYYSLYDLEAFKPDSIHHKAWLAFLDKWNKLMLCLIVPLESWKHLGMYRFSTSPRLILFFESFVQLNGISDVEEVKFLMLILVWRKKKTST